MASFFGASADVFNQATDSKTVFRSKEGSFFEEEDVKRFINLSNQLSTLGQGDLKSLENNGLGPGRNNIDAKEVTKRSGGSLSHRDAGFLNLSEDTQSNLVEGFRNRQQLISQRRSAPGIDQTRIA